MMLGVSSGAHEKHSKENCMNNTKTRVFTIVVLAGLAAIYAQRRPFWHRALRIPISARFSVCL